MFALFVLFSFSFFLERKSKVEDQKRFGTEDGKMLENEHPGFGSWVIWSNTILCRDAINRGDRGKNNSRTFERFSYFFNCSKIRIKLSPTNGVENCD